MSTTHRLERLGQFLRHYQGLWNREIIHAYPHGLQCYPESWIEALAKLTLQERWQVDAKMDRSPLRGTPLYDVLSEMEELCQFPAQEIPKRQWQNEDFYRVRGKKRHEIERLVPFIGEHCKRHSYQSILDLGSGVGHLGRSLAFLEGIPTTCLEKNSEFIELGKKRLTKWQEKLKRTKRLTETSFHFLHCELSAENLHEMRGHDVLTGLHTCGPLALHQLELFLQGDFQSAINFGCCYLKLDPKKHVNLSRAAKKLALPIAPHALTLASRSDTAISFQDYLFKYRVKKFRYGLHLLLFHYFEEKAFLTVGDAPKELYQKNFSAYARQKLLELGKSHSQSDKFFDDFFHEAETAKKIERMALANHIRWPFGRAVESFLLLDRALYLEERGVEATLTTFFDEEISPRNIGLVAVKNASAPPETCHRE